LTAQGELEAAQTGAVAAKGTQTCGVTALLQTISPRHLFDAAWPAHSALSWQPQTLSLP
jgi:hypothetical protein